MAIKGFEALRDAIPKRVQRCAVRGCAALWCGAVVRRCGAALWCGAVMRCAPCELCGAVLRAVGLRAALCALACCEVAACHGMHPRALEVSASPFFVGEMVLVARVTRP